MRGENDSFRFFLLIAHTSVEKTTQMIIRDYSILKLKILCGAVLCDRPLEELAVFDNGLISSLFVGGIQYEKSATKRSLILNNKPSVLTASLLKIRNVNRQIKMIQIHPNILRTSTVISTTLSI